MCLVVCSGCLDKLVWVLSKFDKFKTKEKGNFINADFFQSKLYKHDF